MAVSGPQDGNEHDAREPDAAFLKIPKDKRCFLIWRIENFELVPWTDFGAFYTGDSYLILHAYTKERSQAILRDIYFWLGSESTQDEYGTAAMKAVELDDFFGGSPNQHREIQYHESPGFYKLFEEYGGVRYMEGGIDSGFRKVEANSTSVLYQIKGRKNPILQQVKLSGESLNDGDVFILQTPKTIFLWVGRTANPMEKQKGNNVWSLLKSRYPKLAYSRLESNDNDPEFWEVLGGQVPIKSGEQGGNDHQFEVSNVRSIGKLEGDAFTVIATGPAAKRELLTSDGIYIVLRGSLCVIFLGKDSDKSSQSRVMVLADQYLRGNNFPEWVPIATAKEGAVSDQLDLVFA
jgi:hypothetical protein